MSSFSTIYSFARKYGLRYFVTQEQYDQLTFYFEPENLALSILERDLPHYYLTILGFRLSRLYWRKPWEKIDKIDNNFKYDKMNNEELHVGQALNIGDYPNDVKTYKDYLSELRRRFKLREVFREKAQDLLHSELMRRNMLGSDITWVGVHIRRGDYKVK